MPRVMFYGLFRIIPVGTRSGLKLNVISTVTRYEKVSTRSYPRRTAEIVWADDVGAGTHAIREVGSQLIREVHV